MLAALSILAFPALSATMTPVVAAPMIVEAHYTLASPGPAAGPANRMVGGIISYVRWPEGSAAGPTDICVIGTPRFTLPVAPTLPGGIRARVTFPSSKDVMDGSLCDALFLGRMPVADRQKLIEWVRGKPVLTITDDDPTCAYGAMFCLIERKNNVSFSVNLDSISRSNMRVDPRVLRIGSEGQS